MSTDDKINIEGTFTDPVIVNFPGGAQVTASVLGRHRATVTVPASATAGDLTITACNAMLGPLSLRRASFETGLLGFQTTLDQATGARQTPALVTARAHHTATSVGRYVYVLGGAGSTGVLNSVERASTNADGTLGPFATSSDVTLVSARQGHTSAIVGSYLYVIGGQGNGTLSSIERAAIRSDGSLQPFAVVPDVTLTAARQGHASVVIGASLYVLGGIDGQPLDSVERAPIHADGSLGRFATVSGVHLLASRHEHTTAVVGNYLYVIGGIGNAGPLADLERAEIGGDGALGPFTPVPGVNLATPRSGHATVVLGKSLYIIGGIGSDTALDSVERASIDASDTLGTFTVLRDTLQVARHDHATAIVGNYLYILGGVGAVPLAGIEQGTLDISGTLEVSPAPAFDVVVPRSQSTTVVIGSSLYVIGGDTASSATSVERSAVDSDGMLQPFAKVPSVTLVTPRRRHTAVVIANYLYVVAGTGASGVLKTVERAQIKADGLLGPFEVVASLTVPRQDHTSVVIGNYLYVIGGDDGSKLLSSLERALINEDGSLGTFATVQNVALGFPRQGHQNVVIGRGLYVLGGDQASVERSTIQLDGSLGAFVEVFSLSNPERYEASVAVVGNRLYVIGGQLTLGQGGNEIGTIAFTSLQGFTPGLVVVPPRFGHSMAVLGNYLYIMGGMAGMGATGYVGIQPMSLK